MKVSLEKFVDAVREFRNQGLIVSYEFNGLEDCYVIGVKRGLIGAVEKVDRLDVEKGEGGDRLLRALNRCVIHVEHEERKGMTAEQGLQLELQRYKDAVKQLSFELEMAQGNSASVKVAEIRKIALEQAAEFVMDWGIPTGGKDLEELCKQITLLRETKSPALKRQVKTKPSQQDEVPF